VSLVRVGGPAALSTPIGHYDACQFPNGWHVNASFTASRGLRARSSAVMSLRHGARISIRGFRFGLQSQWASSLRAGGATPADVPISVAFACFAVVADTQSAAFMGGASLALEEIASAWLATPFHSAPTGYVVPGAQTHTCTQGAAPHCPATTCKDLPTSLPGYPNAWLVPAPYTAPTAAYAALCRRDLDDAGRGGWTLVATVSRDGVATWTTSQSSLATTSTSFFGTTSRPDLDFRSPAFRNVLMRDLLFTVHVGGAVSRWASYLNVNGGTSDYGSFANSVATCRCLAPSASEPSAFIMNAGNLSATCGSQPCLCSNRMAMNPTDRDGVIGACSGCTDNFATGPAWEMINNAGACAWDDPSHSSFFAMESSSPTVELSVLSWSYALGLTPVADTSVLTNFFTQMWVR
jgi:hypothetical protein